jgi:2-succinyl-5-enolpyruvyl-6-hydroxy-3-cyclohexene-1-carboxylate synthase
MSEGKRPAELNAHFAERIARSLCHENGKTVVIVSPGSRSTPLVIAFDREPRAEVHVVLDERAAGFVAIGVGRATGRAAVLLCTSGSAFGHYLPAIMEASQARVPLIAISADRPDDLQHCGAPQTLPQAYAFERWTRLSVALPTGDEASDERWLRNVATRVRNAAHASPPGPVHVNAPFRKPLWGPCAPAGPLPATRSWFGTRSLDDTGLAELASVLSNKRGAIVCGPLAPATLDAAELERSVTKLAAELGWPVLADPASGVRYGLGPHSSKIASYDAFIEHADVVPDVVLRIGQAPTSKALVEWLARVARDACVLIDPDGQWHDPSHAAHMLVVADPASTCRSLAPLVTRVTGEWLARWKNVEEIAHGALAACSGKGEWEGRVARTVVESLPEGAQLHVASSMPIRDVDTFAPRAKPIRVHSNRGCNGIDGMLSTLLGESLSSQGLNVALMGDLAFCHDVGGLQAWSGSGASGIAVVVNNEGGGIFEKLPVAKQIDRDTFERLFATPQSLDIGEACAAVGAFHVRVRPSELADAIEAASQREGLTVLEVMIIRAESVACREEALERVSAAVNDRKVRP